MALPQLPAHAQHQLGQGVNKENPLTRVYAKRAAHQFSGSLRVCSLSHGNKYSPPCPWMCPLLGEEPYRAIISVSLRQCPLVPRVGIPTAAYALGGVPMSAHFVRVI